MVSETVLMLFTVVMRCGRALGRWTAGSASMTSKMIPITVQTSVKGPFSGPDHRKFDSRFSTVAAAIEDRHRTGPLH